MVQTPTKLLHTLNRKSTNRSSCGNYFLVHNISIWEFKDPQYPLYPTQKNMEMLNLIIRTSSHTESIVLDCFCGSGTTLVAAEALGRRWIGIDQSHQAIEVAKKRLGYGENFLRRFDNQS